MNNSSSFGLYEMARIIVPGYYFAILAIILLALLATAFQWVFVISDAMLVLGFIMFGFVAGITLYAKEGTKRRKAFQENQPSFYLKTKSRSMADLPVMEEAEAKEVYFYILNNHIPPVFHEKIFFFGTIYHIMTQIRRTSLWFGLVGLALSMAPLLFGRGYSIELLIFTGAVWMIYLLNITYNKADRKMQENYKDQITWLEMNDELIETILHKRAGGKA